MMTEAEKRAHRQAVAEDGRRLAELLAAYPADVQEFARREFQLHMYPLAWVQKFCDALDAFRRPS